MFPMARMETVVEAALLHPSTSPEAIARAQRAAVREASDALFIRGEVRTAESLSAEACLPVSVVVRRLDEMKRKKPA